MGKQYQVATAVCGYQAPLGFADANWTAYTRAGSRSHRQAKRGSSLQRSYHLAEVSPTLGSLQSDLIETVSAERNHNDAYAAARRLATVDMRSDTSGRRCL